MKVLVAGDFCPLNRVAIALEKGLADGVLGKVKPIADAADYAIVNLECPITYGSEKRIRKCGPNLHCTEAGVSALRWAGFDCVTLANNHFRDFGDEGVNKTLGACTKTGLDTVGGGKELQEAGQTLFKNIGNKTLAVINCCEHEFSLATEHTGGSNPLAPLKQFYAIREARTRADYVLVVVHGGHEHYQLPSTRMQDTYRFFIDAGADALLNHHQHCYSGYEVYQGKPIFYGLGNFCFDEGMKMNKTWYEGYMVTIAFDRQITFELHPYLQCKDDATVELVSLNDIESELSSLNEIIADREKLVQCVRDYYQSSLHNSNLTLEPITNRYVRALQHRHLLPKFPFNRKYIVRLYNFLFCEAHRDKINFFLETEYEKCNKS